MKSNQPKLELEPRSADMILDWTAWLILALVWVFAIYTYRTLPERIPTHFNFRGEADGYGGKQAILLLPAILTVTVTVMTVGLRSPHKFNYPVSITPANAEWQYRNSVLMLRVLRMSILLVFTIVVFMIRSSALGIGPKPGIWLLPVILLLVTGPTVFFLVRMLRHREVFTNTNS